MTRTFIFCSALDLHCCIILLEQIYCVTSKLFVTCPKNRADAKTTQSYFFGSTHLSDMFHFRPFYYFGTFLRIFFEHIYTPHSQIVSRSVSYSGFFVWPETPKASKLLGSMGNFPLVIYLLPMVGRYK